MDKISLFLVAVCGFVKISGAAECESGWTLYKDELCIKLFSAFFSYDQAKLMCEAQSNSASSASLLMVKDSSMQEFLMGYTNNIYENVWLGGKYDKISSQFKWEDGDTLLYSDWAKGYPKNIDDSEVCIQFTPKNTKSTTKIDGSWEDAACRKRNLAICQRTVELSLKDATREIINLRKKLETTTKTLDDTRHDLQTVCSMVVPVGSVYIEYFNQPSPVTLWPNLGWENITSSYAGLFFRALGENSESWGNTQSGAAPRISEVQYQEWADMGVNPVQLPENGWSEYMRAGRLTDDKDWFHERLRYHVEGSEVRPRNQAIRMWKRTS